MKIKLIPKDDHVEAVKKLYDKELTPAKFTVQIQENGETWTLQKDEWEIVKD